MIYRICCVCLLCIFVSGCQTLNYDAAKGKLVLTNLEIAEAFDSTSKRHEVIVSFDYAFTANFTQPSVYFCTVQFLGKQAGRSYSGMGRGPAPCQFTEDKGSVSFRWATPLDGDNRDRRIIEDLLLPVQYFVAVHQKVGKNQSNIIAYSQTFQSTK